MMFLVEGMIVVQLSLESLFHLFIFKTTAPRVLVSPLFVVTVVRFIVGIYLIGVLELFLVVTGNPVVISHSGFQAFDRALPFRIYIGCCRFPDIIGITGDIPVENSGTGRVVAGGIYVVWIIIGIGVLGRPVLEHGIIRLPVVIQTRNTYVMAFFDTTAQTGSDLQRFSDIGFNIALQVCTGKVKSVDHGLLVEMGNTEVVVNSFRTSGSTDVTVPDRSILVGDELLPVEAGIFALALTPQVQFFHRTGC